MSLHVITFKLSDGTTQTQQVPAASTVDQFLQHIRSVGGFWTDRTLQAVQGATVGAVFVNWEQVVSVTYTS